MKESKCPFCTIAREQVVLDHPLAYAKRDSYPVSNLHIHIVPRYHGDKADPRGGIRGIFPEQASYSKTQ